jgi:hypothetical protein
MGQFLYFVENLKGMPMPRLAEFGLWPVLGNESFNRLESIGPENKAGVLLAWVPRTNNRERAPRYVPHEQTWTKNPRANHWVGFWNDRPPTEADLRRETTNGVNRPKLGNGEQWVVPTAKLYPKGTGLPQTRGIDEEGKVVRRVQPEYEQVMLDGDLVWNHALTGEGIPDEESFEICVRALAVNYRVGPLEVSLLRLLDDDTETLICWALIDRISWKDAENTEPLV